MREYDVTVGQGEEEEDRWSHDNDDDDIGNDDNNGWVDGENDAGLGEEEDDR